MSEWKEYKLGEIAVVKGGKRLPKGELLVDYETPHPYIRVTDIVNKWIHKKGLMYVTSEIQKTISRYTVNYGDVILSIVGSIGFVARIGYDIDGANLTENCVKIVTNKDVIDDDYLYYYLKSSIGQEEINKRNVGAVQPKLPIYNINDIIITLPSLEIQHSIASILSSLDDKIDLLYRENATLEAMA
ncbi:MAG: restriction endonuclease subunit S [Bacteroidales bacterium]|nr:restriction endonuclease subunit S [Bacteroidales bacterium]